jgi:hypothetical protein
MLPPNLFAAVKRRRHTMLPLARDQHGNAFEIPPEAAFWRVRRQTGGRPSNVLGPDNEPLYIPIGGDRLDLYANGCSGSLRLEAVDGDYHPVEAPVAYVEIASNERPEPRNAASTDGHSDLVRVSFESMTRTMEAMQRAQVERERALAQKERAVTDAQVAMQRSHDELVIALLDRATGGKPQDPVAVLEQHVKLQRVIERQAPRNGGLLMAPPSSDENQEGGKGHWMASVLPFTPLATQMIAKMFGSGDKKATEMARNAGNIAQAVGALQNGDANAVQTLAEGMIGGIAAATQPDATAEPQQPHQPQVQVVEVERWSRPRPIREVLAHLDDEASEAFDGFLDTLDEGSFERVCETSASIANLDERAEWARQFLLTQTSGGEASVPSTLPNAQELPDVPPALFPVLAQLTPEERTLGAQLLFVLDRASVDAFTAKLAAMPQEKALRTIREAIAEVQRRSASVAHRAVHAAMSSVDAADGAES